MTFAAGAKLRASALNAALALATPIFARKATDGTPVNNSATLGNDEDLLVSVEANAVYEFTLDLRYTTNTTADIKIGWTYPTGLTLAASGFSYSTGEALQLFNNQTESSTPGFGGTTGYAHLVGVITVGSTAGTLQLQRAQNTATVTNTTVLAGSALRLTRIS